VASNFKKRMKPQEVINNIESAYKKADMIYEMMFAHFIQLSGFHFRTIKIKQGSLIYRARYSVGNNSFAKLSDVSYPQKEFVQNFSRLNRPYQNLFYASETEKTCLSEMIPYWIDKFNKGDIFSITLGEWIVRNELKLIIIPDASNINERNINVLGQLDKPEIEFWNYFSNKFKTSTKQDKDIYEFTSAFGNALWLNSKIQKIDSAGFMYSSVQSPKNLNIALCTSSIDNGDLVPVEFVEMHVQRGDLNKKGLPTYKEIGDRKRGLIDLNKALIDWK
ncbi:MAG: RES domain-containing protein, partial [Bacteroidales bacterium]|nr:RES domain-containing protein [Bacteroidales bacterium]